MLLCRLGHHKWQKTYFEVKGENEYGRFCKRCNREQVFILEVDDWVWVDLEIFKEYYKPLHEASTAEVIANYA